MTEFASRTITTNGIRMRIVEVGEGPLVVLVHGFPESWYSWRHQLPALADAGYHAVAIDVRGYGETDGPEPVEAYTMKELTADVAGVIEALGEESAVIVGHDWGSMISWHTALLHPKRVRAVAGLSVAYAPRAPMPPTQLMKQIFGDHFFYILYFQEPGVAEAEFEPDIRRFLRLFYHSASGEAPEVSMLPEKKKGATFLEGLPEPAQSSAWLSDADLDYYVAAFERAGVRGGLNRYRNMDRDWEELPQLAGAKIEQPALFIIGERDPVRRFTNPEGMREHAKNLRDLVVVPGAGHWVQQERPKETNEALLAFLRGLA